MEQTTLEQGGQVPANHVLQTLVLRYPQLSLTPEAGLASTQLYRIVVGNAEPLPLTGYITSPLDRFWAEETPAGPVDVLFLAERADFERAYRLLALRGEPKPIPSTMGASTLFGLVNRQRVAEKQRELEAAGGDQQAAFEAWKAVKSNYLDTLVLLSNGFYSGLPAEQTPFPSDEWREKSLLIRLYHELAHVTCRRLFPEWKHPVFDELTADAFGLLRALGRYDLPLARAFLGISADGFTAGGRLANYAQAEQLDALARAAYAVTNALHDRTAADDAQPFAPLLNWMAHASELAAPLDQALQQAAGTPS